MASAIFKPSRIISVLILLGAAGWIASGVFAPSAHEEEPVETPAAETPAIPVQKVTVASATPEEHQRQITLSCTTRSRSQLGGGRPRQRHHHRPQGRARRPRSPPARRLATLSDEGREAMVAQAKALLDQRDRRIRSDQEADRQGPGAEEPACRRSRRRSRRPGRRSPRRRPRPTGRSSARRSTA